MDNEEIKEIEDLNLEPETRMEQILNGETLEPEDRTEYFVQKALGRFGPTPPTPPAPSSDTVYINAEVTAWDNVMHPTEFKILDTPEYVFNAVAGTKMVTLALRDDSNDCTYYGHMAARPDVTGFSDDNTAIIWFPIALDFMEMITCEVWVSRNEISLENIFSGFAMSFPKADDKNKAMFVDENLNYAADKQVLKILLRADVSNIEQITEATAYTEDANVFTGNQYWEVINNKRRAFTFSVGTLVGQGVYTSHDCYPIFSDGVYTVIYEISSERIVLLRIHPWFGTDSTVRVDPIIIPFNTNNNS